MNDVNTADSTKLYIDVSSNTGDLIESFMTTIDSVDSNIKGFVRLSKKNSSSNYLSFKSPI